MRFVSPIGLAALLNDAIITFQEISDETEDFIRSLRQQYRNQPDVLKQKVDQLQNDAVAGLIEHRLILDEFKSAGYKMTESYIDEEIKRRIRDRFGDRARMIKSLQSQGMTFDAFRERIREEFIVLQMEYKNIGSEIIVSPHKIETYYAQHSDDFKLNDEVKLRMIFLADKPERDAEATRKLAGEIIGKIEGGAPFAEMASMYSDGSQKSKGGEWDWIEKKVLREDLAEVAFSLKPGQRSGVIEKPDGCYLMLVEDSRPAHVKPLNEVRAEIEKTLETEERRRLRKEWIERLKAKSFIRFFPTS